MNAVDVSYKVLYKLIIYVNYFRVANHYFLNNYFVIAK